MTSHAPVRLPALPAPLAVAASRAAVVLLVGLGCVGAPAAPAAAATATASPTATPAATASDTPSEDGTPAPSGTPTESPAPAETPAATDGASPAATDATPAPSETGTPSATPTAAPPVIVTERTPLPFRTLRRADASRYRGTEVVVRAGRTGVLERTWVAPQTGDRVLLREERLREPVTKVVAVGTKPKPTYGGLDFAALARCESGGDPRAVSRTGKYRGLYQFSLSTWRSVGGKGDPAGHSRDSQTAHAYKLYQRDGRAPWPHCGRHL